MREQDRRVLERFRDRVRGGATRGVRVTLRVSGGLPAERLDQQIVLEGGGLSRFEIFDAREGKPRHTREEPVDTAVAATLLSEIVQRLDRLTPLRDVAFVPDSLVGRAVIEVDEQRTELFFEPDRVLLPTFRDVSAGPLADLAARMVFAVQRAPLDEEV